MNLAVNARDAMPNGGRLVIETRSEIRDAGTLPPGAPPGRYSVVVMADTGHGMTEQLKLDLAAIHRRRRSLGHGFGSAALFMASSRKDAASSKSRAAWKGSEFLGVPPRHRRKP